MITLNSILSIVVVVIYVPLLVFAIRIIVSSKDPLRRWRTLLACVLYRLAGSALFIPSPFLASSAFLSESLFDRPPATQTYFTLCLTLDVCSSWALTVCTAYLINIADEGEVTQRGSSSVTSGQRNKKSTKALRLPGNVVVIAMIPIVWAILFVVLDVFSTLSAVSVILLPIASIGPVTSALLFITVVRYAVRTWFRFERMLHYRKRLLVLITVALPFITVRVAYGILNAFSPVTIWFTGDSEYYPVNLYTNRLAVFSMFEGSQIYLAMDVLMECVVVIIYTVAGTMLPLDEDYRLADEHPFPRLQHLGDTENQL